jgi:hypothetical protein
VRRWAGCWVRYHHARWAHGSSTQRRPDCSERRDSPPYCGQRNHMDPRRRFAEAAAHHKHRARGEAGTGQPAAASVWRKHATMCRLRLSTRDTRGARPQDLDRQRTVVDSAQRQQGCDWPGCSATRHMRSNCVSRSPTHRRPVMELDKYQFLLSVYT